MSSIDCILSTYNRAEHFLPRAIRSVLAQTHADLTLWVCDDASTDDTAKVTRAFAKEDPRVRYICTRQNDGYQCVPKNLGIRAGAAPFIAYLDDDNEWHPDHLARLVAACAGADFAYAARTYANDPVHPSPEPPLLGEQMPWGIAQVTEWDPRRIRYENWIDTSDILHTRQAIQRLGGWDESCRVGADWNLMQRVAMAALRVVNVPEVLTTYYWHGTGHAGRRPLGTPALWSLTHNRLYDVQRSFASLWQFTQSPYLHYVLDQGSTDGTAEWLADIYREGRIHYLRLEPSNIGISRGSNALLDVALPGDFHMWLCKWDPDIVCQTPRWLERLAKRCPEKAAISPHVLGLMQHPGGAPRTSRDATRRLGFVKHLGGAVNLAPAAAWHDFGRWAVPAPAHGLQDAEFSTRLRDKGWTLCHAEDILVRHIQNERPEIRDAQRRLIV